MKHTPGPWEVNDTKADVRVESAGEHGWANDGWAICQLMGPECDANARLIAAAPDIFRELSHLVALLEPIEREGRMNVPGLATLNGARAALARVEEA